jgi:uncharacterized protein (DUF58 family)
LNTLIVKTFDLEPSGGLWIILDMDAAVQAGEGEESTEEYGVILASSLASRALRENRSVGLAAYGSTTTGSAGLQQPLPTMVMPQKGQAQQWRILRALSQVRAGGHWPLGRVLTEMGPNLGRGTTLAVITPSCDPAWVANLLPAMRRGIAPIVLLLDAVTFLSDTLGARNGMTSVSEIAGVAAMMGFLADLGVPSHRIARGMPFEPLTQHRRIGRPAFKVLSGTGRVVAVPLD